MKTRTTHKRARAAENERAREAKRRRVEPTKIGRGEKSIGRNTVKVNTADVDTTGVDPHTSFAQTVSARDLEAEWAARRRDRNSKKKENSRLPIKTADGTIQQVPAPPPEEEWHDSDESEWAGLDGVEKVTGTGASSEDDPRANARLLQITTRKGIIEAQEEMARLARHITENPEENIHSISALTEFTTAQSSTVRYMSVLSLCAVYRDIIPSYKIRPLQEDWTKEKLSRDVRNLRSFEQRLLSGYRRYVQVLEQQCQPMSSPEHKGDEKGAQSSALVSVCVLIKAAPHFNFRDELLQILIGYISRTDDHGDRDKCRGTIEELFRDDDDGYASLAAVNMIQKIAKDNDYRIHEDCLNVLLHMRLLSEYAHKASMTKVDKTKGRDADGQGLDDKLNNLRLKKKHREFRTKRERKVMRERKAIEKEFKEADAQVTAEDREAQQGEILKKVFMLYFRALKSKRPHLVGPTMEGLVKYSHLINADFFGDILELLKDLVREAEEDIEDDRPETQNSATLKQRRRNYTRESLLCFIAAFNLEKEQSAAASATATNSLDLDLGFFISHFWRTLLPASLDCELEDAITVPALFSGRNQEPGQQKVDVNTTIVLLLRTLHALVLPANAHQAPPVRVAGFTKQTMTAALQTPEKSTLALLGTVSQTAKTHAKRKIAALWNTEDRRADGVWNALSQEVEQANPFASTVWEGELLRVHFSPKVREAVQALEQTVLKVL